VLKKGLPIIGGPFTFKQTETEDSHIQYLKLPALPQNINKSNNIQRHIDIVLRPSRSPTLRKARPTSLVSRFFLEPEGE
jgi:hypothetical protein